MEKYFYDLSGGINKADTKTTLGLAPKKLYWADSLNIEIYQNNGVASQKGNVLKTQLPTDLENNSGVAAQINSIFEYPKTELGIILLGTSDGKLYALDTKTGSLSLKKGDLSAQTTLSFTKYNQGVFCTNGSDDPFYIQLDKSPQITPCEAVDALENEIRGTVAASFGSRVWLASGSKLYYSAVGTCFDWATAEDAGYIADFHTDTDEIVALKPYKEYLAIYKKNKTYLLSGSTPENFSIQAFADKGTAARQGVTTVDNKQYFYSDGLFCLSQVGELAQIVMSSDKALLIKPELENVDIKRLSEITVLPYEIKNQIWFFLPFAESEYLRTVWIYDYVNSAWFKRQTPQAVTSAGLCFGRIYTGTADGKLYLEDESNLFDTEPIPFSWKTPFFAFGRPEVPKTIEEFYFLLDENFENKFQMNIYADFNEGEIVDTETIFTYDVWTMLWDDDECKWADGSSNTEVLGTKWLKTLETQYKTEINDGNYSVQIEITGNSTSESVGIIGLAFKDVYFEE